MPFEYPEPFARFYDLIYGRQRDGVDNDFFLEQIRQVTGKVLEVGSGTGRLFAEALHRGADIYGIDVSRHMNEILLQKLAKEYHHRVSLQNICDFHFDFPFDLVIAPFHMMMHLIEKKDQIKALNNVYDHLSPDGRFIFDAFVPDLAMIIEGLDHYTDFEGEYAPGKMMRRIVSTRPDLIRQIIPITYLFEWDEEDEIHQSEWSFDLRFFFRVELEHLVERSRFGSYEILGDYNGNALTTDSKAFIVVCRK